MTLYTLKTMSGAKGKILTPLILSLSLAFAAFAQDPVQITPYQLIDARTGIAIPCVGCSIFTYAAGTNTPLATFTDSTLGTPNTNPVLTNTAGYAVNGSTITGIWVGAACYKFIAKDDQAVTIWTQDHICDQAAVLKALLAGATGAAQIGYQYPAGTAQTVQSKLRQSIDIRDFGALCDGSHDDRAAIQGAWDAANSTNSIVTFPGGICQFSSTLKFYPGSVFMGHGGPQVASGQTRLKYTGAAGSPGIEPATLATANVDLNWQSISFDGNSLANPTVYLFRVGESAFINVGWFAPQTGGSAVVLDGDTNAFEARSVFLNNKWDSASAKGMIFQNGANNSQVIGGFVSGSTVGFSFLSSSVDNSVFGTDFEGVTTTCVVSSAALNRFYGTSMEDCPTGIDLSGGGTRNAIRDPNFAGNVTTPIVYPSGVAQGGVTYEFFNGSTGDLFDSIGYLRQTGNFASGATATYIDPQVQANTASDVLNFFYNVDSSGVKQINMYGGTAAHHLPFSFNLGLGIASLDDVQVNVGGAVGQAVCLTAARKIGYCSTAVGAGGACTCN